jgi:hypothetical protein
VVPENIDAAMIILSAGDGVSGWISAGTQGLAWRWAGLAAASVAVGAGEPAH